MASSFRQAQDQEQDSPPEELRVRVHARDLAAMRRRVEPRLTEHVKHWRIGAIADTDGRQTAEYHVQLKKKASPEELVALFRASGSEEVLNVEVVS